MGTAFKRRTALRAAVLAAGVFAGAGHARAYVIFKFDYLSGIPASGTLHVGDTFTVRISAVTEDPNGLRTINPRTNINETLNVAQTTAPADGYVVSVVPRLPTLTTAAQVPVYSRNPALEVPGRLSYLEPALITFGANGQPNSTNGNRPGYGYIGIDQFGRFGGTPFYTGSTSVFVPFIDLKLKANRAGTAHLQFAPNPGSVQAFNDATGTLGTTVPTSGHFGGNFGVALADYELPIVVEQVPPVAGLTADGSPLFTPIAHASSPGASQATFSSGTSQLRVTGAGGGNYRAGQANQVGGAGGRATASFDVAGFSPTTDTPEIFLLNIKTGGIDPTAAQVAQLVADLNAALGSAGEATAVEPALASALGGAAFYDVELRITPSAATANGTFNIGFTNYTGGSGSSFVNNVTITDVAVIPEPVSLYGAAVALHLLAPRRRGGRPASRASRP